jgi:hypothetical protein
MWTRPVHKQQTDGQLLTMVLFAALGTVLLRYIDDHAGHCTIAGETQFNCTQILCLGIPNAQVPYEDIVRSWVMTPPYTPDSSYQHCGGGGDPAAFSALREYG